MAYASFCRLIIETDKRFTPAKLYDQLINFKKDILLLFLLASLHQRSGKKEHGCYPQRPEAEVDIYVCYLRAECRPLHTRVFILSGYHYHYYHYCNYHYFCSYHYCISIYSYHTLSNICKLEEGWYGQPKNCYRKAIHNTLF